LVERTANLKRFTAMMTQSVSNSIGVGGNGMNYNLSHGRSNVDSASTNKRKNKYSHAVCRSAEFLSCVKTAVRIAQSRVQHNISNGKLSQGSDWITNVNPSDLELYNPNKQKLHSPLNDILQDGLEIMRAMESELRRLNELVRRRGHSNDPTIEISTSVAAIEKDAAELTLIVLSMVQRGSIGQHQNQQRQRHIKAIQEWFQTMIQQYTAQLKEILSVRASVLSDQARRRGMFQPSNNKTSNAAITSLSSKDAYSNIGAVVTSEAQNALFAPLPQRSKPHYTATHLQQQHHPIAEGSIHQQPNIFENNPTSTLLSYGNTNAAMYTGGGYGGSNYYTGTNHNGVGNDMSTTESGMRRRKQQPSSTTTTIYAGDTISDSNGNTGTSQQQQFAVQQQLDLQTTARLKEARQAEQSLAALGTIFGKMSTLIVQQSETLNKIEDDVEAANVDVNAGHNEITTLYSIKKGNRLLIIKVYSLLIFLIVFMRFYARK
jgi:hypothetical protein